MSEGFIADSSVAVWPGQSIPKPVTPRTACLIKWPLAPP